MKTPKGWRKLRSTDIVRVGDSQWDSKASCFWIGAENGLDSPCLVTEWNWCNGKHGYELETENYRNNIYRRVTKQT